MDRNLHPILITGGTGLFGKTFLNNNKKNKKFILSPTRHELDITDKIRTHDYLIRSEPRLIVHAAALVGIRECMTNIGLCNKTNVEGTKNMVDYAKSSGARFVYISTDYIFDGEKGNYSETDKPNPITEYGKSKYAGEKLVRSLKNYLIIRTSFYSKNKWKYKEAFSDQYTSKIEVNLFVKNIMKVLDTDIVGILNIAGKRQSLYNIAKNISNAVKPISINKYGNLYIPKDTSLNISKWDLIKNQGD